MSTTVVVAATRSFLLSTIMITLSIAYAAPRHVRLLLTKVVSLGATWGNLKAGFGANSRIPSYCDPRRDHERPQTLNPFVFMFLLHPAVVSSLRSEGPSMNKTFFATRFRVSG